MPWVDDCPRGTISVKAKRLVRPRKDKTFDKYLILGEIEIGTFIDLTGNKYGRLTVLGEAGMQGHKRLWNCKCDCGNEKVVRGDSLKCGAIQSCGCYMKERTSDRFLKDLTGKKFGRWTVISRAESKGRISRWNCVCECGNTNTIYANTLLSGATKSCGCYKNDRNHELYFDDLTGKKFGYLTVIERAENKYTKSGSMIVRWRCKCDCGNEKIVQASSLKQTKFISCGCQSISNGELLIKSYLESNKIDYISQYKFKDCKNKYPLPFDFYIPSKNICIEYDGKQHFEPIEYFGGEEKFAMQMNNDKIKNEYCENNNISLVRIPYYMKNADVLTTLSNVLNP